MTRFQKPGEHDPCTVSGVNAVRDALADAGLDYGDIRQAHAGHVYGDSTCGQNVLYKVGMTGIPVVNVNNTCSTGSTALYLARQAVDAGVIDCALAPGFETMQRGALGDVWTDRPNPFGPFNDATEELVGHGEIPLALRYFGGAVKSHMDKYGSTLRDLAEIRAKASRHAAKTRWRSSGKR